MRAFSSVGPAVLCATALLAGCGGVTESRVEARLRDELSRGLGPASRYDVHVEGIDRDEGTADRVEVVGYGIRPRQGPTIDRLELELRDVRYDRKLKRLDRAEVTHATAWLSSADLGDFLARQDGVGAASVTLAGPDSVFVHVRPDLGGFPVPPGANLEVAGTIQARGPYVEYHVSEVNALGGHLGDAIVKRVTRLINPLLDLSELPLRLDVSRVSVEGRRIRLDAGGTATALRR
jgi:hypothetical protein